MWLEAISAEEGGGVSTSVSVEDGKLHVKHDQDVSAVIEQNKRLADGPQHKDMKLAASVPFIVLQMWANDAGLKMDDPAFKEVVKRRLNDPEMKAFRVYRGRL